MGTKSKPGKFDCLQKARPDEPLFVLLARDPHAPATIRYWAELQHGTGAYAAEKALEACSVAREMEKWYRETDTYKRLLCQRDKLRTRVGELEERLRVLTGPVAQDANRYRELRNNHLDFAVTMPRKSGLLAYFGEALDLKVDESIRRGLDTARVLREEPDHG